MSAVAYSPRNHTEYLIRLQDHSVVFTPINTRPLMQNFFLLETCEEYRYNPEAQKFLPFNAHATLLMKKGDRTYKLQGFRALSLELLLQKVARRIKTHYLKMK